MSKTRRAKAVKFPKAIYVNRETEVNGESSYLLASENTDTIDDGEAVAVYELREVRRKRVEHSLDEA